MKTKEAKNQDPTNSRIAMVLGLNVRYYRLIKNYSQEELAFKADIHRNHIGIIERGKANSLLLNIEKLAEVLEVKFIDLFLDPPNEINMTNFKALHSKNN